MQDLPANPGGMLLSTINENNNPKLLLWSEPNVGRSVRQPAVLVNDGEVAGADDLPGETYR